MKKLVLLIAISFLSSATFAQSKYNKALADSLGADDYGMKSYVLAILKTGENKTTDKKITDSLFRGHMNNINRLVEEGKLIIAGPLGKNSNNYRGIFIFDVKTVEEAKALVDTDPAVKAKVFDIELYPWYGSAALPVYLETSEQITKQSP